MGKHEYYHAGGCVWPPREMLQSAVKRYLIVEMKGFKFRLQDAGLLGGVLVPHKFKY